MRLFRVFSCTLVMVAGGAVARGAPADSWKMFTSRTGGYVAYFPPSWHMFPPADAPTLNVYSFPFSRAGGGVLAEDGASIAMLAAPKGVGSPQEWIDRNA
jgi:hypothetical protein